MENKLQFCGNVSQESGCQGRIKPLQRNSRQKLFTPLNVTNGFSGDLLPGYSLIRQPHLKYLYFCGRWVRKFPLTSSILDIF